MKMRKLLAVVLAVTMAISAMALSVFAEDIEIDLYNYSYSSACTATYTYTIPAYGNYGILNQGDYLLITLPTSLAADTVTSGTSTVVESYALYDDTGALVDIITADEYEAGAYPAGNKYDDADYFPVYDGANGVVWYDNDEDNYNPSHVFASSTTVDIDTNNYSGTASDGDYYVTVLSGEDLTDRDITIAVTMTPASGVNWEVGTFGSINLNPSDATDNGDGTYTQYITVTDLEVAGDDVSGTGFILNWWAASQSYGTINSVVMVEAETKAYASTCVDTQASTIITPATYAAGAYAAGNTYEDDYTVEPYTYATVSGTDVVTPAYNFEVSYTLTVNGVTVDLKDPADLDTWVDTTQTWDASAHYGLYTQQVNISTFARDYSTTDNGVDGTYVNATIPQSTLVSESTNIVITATVTYDGYSSHLAQSWEFAAGWWPSWEGTATVYYYDVDVVGTGASDAVVAYWGYGSGYEYGYGTKVEYYEDTDWDVSTSDSVLVGTVYAANGMTASGPNTNDASTSQNNVVIITDVDTDGETSQALAWDHTLLNRSTILTAYNTEGATAKVVVELDGSVSGFAIYTLNTVADIASSEVWTNDAYWYTSVGNSALNVTAASTYVLTGGTTSTLVFEDVPLSTLYDSTYGVFNSYMSITQVITADDNSSVDYYYYTNSSDNTLEATRVYLVISMPDDDADLTVEDPVEPGDTDTEGEGSEDLTVEEPAVEETETNPTTGIVLALVPMAVAAAAAVASKRR